MKQYHKLLLLGILVLLQAGQCLATHTFGGELLYQYIGDNNYRVVLTMYGDCLGENFTKLYDASPSVNIYNGNSFFKTLILHSELTMGEEVSPVCPDEINNTSCKGGTLPGVTRFIYSDTVTIPFASADWQMVFTGVMGNNSFAGRSNSITNIAPSTSMFLAAKLNNINGPNNSPQFSTIPTPFYCINVQQQYNQGAGDADNDSLFFTLMPALDENGIQVAYTPPYYPEQPIATANFSFNNLNGQMSFLPNLVQKSVVVNRVDEYRNGVLVGSSMREMTIIVLDNCDNNPPAADSLKAEDIAGGLYIGNNIINICEGITDVNFNLPVKDKDGDKISVKINNLPKGSTASVIDNNTKHPIINFKWNITNTPPGVYNIYVNLTDDNCPLSSNQTVAYTIQILKPAEVYYDVINPTRCLYDEYTRLTVYRGATPRSIRILQDGKVIKQYYDTTGIIQDHFKPGNYKAIVTSPNLLCTTDFDFTVADSGSYPYSPQFDEPHYCPHDSIAAIEITPGRYGNIKWYNMDGTLLDKSPSFNTETPQTYSWLVTETYKTCESLFDTFHVYVHEPPVAAILNEPKHLCLGDKVQLLGGDNYTYSWYPREKVFTDREGNFYTRVIAPQPYYAVAMNEYGCKDTTSITFSDIENCCTFSYPTAFTPNGDGKNDGFRALLYGNEETYDIRIFNRWGQMVFRSESPSEYWNGNFGGKPCETGTYYYMVRAKCMTGHVEDQKGEVMLIR